MSTRKHRDKPRPANAVANDPKPQSKTVAAGKSALDVFINTVLELVDSEHCPSAWSPEIDAGFIFDQGELSPIVSKFLYLSEERYGAILRGMTDDESRFCLKALKSERSEIRDEIEKAIIEMRVAGEMPPVVLGLALGLRLARVEISHARTIIAGFLRNY
jgi:hypothetical protein